jgi:hypothetical protein
VTIALAHCMLLRSHKGLCGFYEVNPFLLPVFSSFSIYLNSGAFIWAPSLSLLAYGFAVPPAIILLFACDTRELSKNIRREDEFNRSFYTLWCAENFPEI